MQNRELDTEAETKFRLSRQAVERQAEGPEAQGILSAQRDPLAQVTCRIGDASCASAHASTLSRATVGQPSGAGQSLLQLQRQYGNRYVQRVLALARQGEGNAEVAPEMEQAIQRARAGGQPLDRSFRTRMEPAFGADFRGARVHTDAQADALNQALNARAFTTGQDIFFRQGEYTPGSSSGRELVARELTHVVQQNGDKVQRRLAVGQPGDQHEQEADRVAEQVMGTPEPMPLIFSNHSRPDLQRKCAECASGESLCSKSAEEENMVQRKLLVTRITPLIQRQAMAEPEAEEEEETFQKEDVSGSTPKVTPDIEADINALEGSGQLLPESVRAFFEPRFGHDFSQVRIHTDLRAGATARTLRAEAFTTGRNIAFAPGRYAPNAAAGQRLLAHELSHIVQQGHGRAAPSDMVLPYRNKNAVNFGLKDKPNLGLVEEEFIDSEKQPWIEQITLTFDDTKIDDNNEMVATGKLHAKYHGNKVALQDIKESVVGGSTALGLTDQGKGFKVHRIEGFGYNDVIPPDPLGKKWPKSKYSKSGAASMHYAVFFKGKQAIHGGSLDIGSHACIHVEWDDLTTIRRINYHSVRGKTKVDVTYEPKALKVLCCSRHQAVGKMVKNPCKGQDPKKCP